MEIKIKIDTTELNKAFKRLVEHTKMNISARRGYNEVSCAERGHRNSFMSGYESALKHVAELLGDD